MLNGWQCRGVAEIEFRFLSLILGPKNGKFGARVRIEFKMIWLRFKLNMKEKTNNHCVGYGFGKRR